MNKFLTISFLLLSINSFCKTNVSAALFYLDEQKLNREFLILNELETALINADSNYYHLGEKDAAQYFENPIHILAGFLIGIITPAAFGVVGYFESDFGAALGCALTYGLILPGVIEGVINRLPINIPDYLVSDRKLLGEVSYVHAYKNVAKKKRKKKTRIGMFAGFGIGLVALATLLVTQESIL
ncbi:hypothetical protein JYT53_00980 [Cytophagaceae bacterium AH-315-L13]|nr:hypothetical protein [Cytophagaceae bacterium AH-315-L13]